MIYLQYIYLFTTFALRKRHLTPYRESLTSDSEPRSSVLTNLPTFKDINKDVLIFFIILLIQSTIFYYRIYTFAKVVNSHLSCGNLYRNFCFFMILPQYLVLGVCLKLLPAHRFRCLKIICPLQGVDGVITSRFIGPRPYAL